MMLTSKPRRNVVLAALLAIIFTILIYQRPGREPSYLTTRPQGSFVTPQNDLGAPVDEDYSRAEQPQEHGIIPPYLTNALSTTIPPSSTISSRTSIVPSTTSASAPAGISRTPISDILKSEPEQNRWCKERYGSAYLQSLSNTSAEYCTSASHSSLRCFHSRTAKDGRVDSFCITGETRYDDLRTYKPFLLDCEKRVLSAEEKSRGIIDLDRFQHYWYNTGPKAILHSQVDIKDGSDIEAEDDDGPGVTNQRHFTILVQREEVVTNLWHNMLQIQSLMITLWTLSITNDANGIPLWTYNDIPNTRVVIVDQHDKGPFWDLWGLFSGEKVHRLDELATQQWYNDQLIIPLAGGSNPLWQGDWELHDCASSPMLSAFTNEVLDLYGVSRLGSSRAYLPTLNVTIINRVSKRRLINIDLCFSAAKKAYLEKHPGTQINFRLVDFATLSMADQVRTAADTDVLIGVHGAGLTHGMFMAAETSVIGEILPANLQHVGFHNLATLKKYSYRSIFAEKPPPGVAQPGTGDWHEDDLYVKKDAFLQLVDDAIKTCLAMREHSRQYNAGY